MRKKKKALIAGLAIFAGASATVSVLTMSDIFAANDECTVVASADWGADVNSLNGLYTAFGAGSCVDKDANTNTITLKKNIVANKQIHLNKGTNVEREYKINLNGHTITTKKENDRLFTLYKGAKLTVGGQGDITNNYGKIFAIGPSSELTINDGKYTASSSIFSGLSTFNDGKGKLKITGGVFNSKDAFTAFPFDVSISGGTFNSEKSVIRVGNNYNRETESLNKKYSSSVIITGNPIFRSDVNANGVAVRSGVYPAIQFDNVATGKGKTDSLMIQGGTFEGSYGGLVIYGTGAEKIITGGSFKNSSGSYAPAISMAARTEGGDSVSFADLLVSATKEFKNASEPLSTKGQSETGERMYKGIFGIGDSPVTVGDKDTSRETDTTCRPYAAPTGMISPAYNSRDITYYLGGINCVAYRDATGEFKLKKDIVLDKGIELHGQGSYTIDLNGHSITGDDGISTMFKVNGPNKLVMTGEGNVTLKGNIFEQSGGDISINGGNYDGNYIVNVPGAVSSNGKLRISGGNIHTKFPITTSLLSYTAITGGTITSENNVLNVGNGFVADLGNGNISHFDSKTNVNGSSVVLRGGVNADGTASRNGGVAIAYDDRAVSDAGRKGSLMVQNGTFEGTKGALAIYNITSDNKIVAQGGSYNTILATGEAIPAVNYRYGSSTNIQDGFDLNSLLISATMSFQNASELVSENIGGVTWKGFRALNGNPITVGGTQNATDLGEEWNDEGDSETTGDDRTEEPEDMVFEEPDDIIDKLPVADDKLPGDSGEIVSGDDGEGSDGNSSDKGTSADKGGSNSKDDVKNDKSDNPFTGDKATALVPIMSGSMAAAAGAAIYIVKKRML